MFVLRADHHVKPAEWTVAGTYDEGHGLLIELAGTYSGCARNPTVRLISETDAVIELEAEFTDPPCDTLEGAAFPAVRVPLSEAIDGRVITGRLRMPPANTVRPPRLPEVRGLNADDARAALERFGLELPPATRSR